MVLFPAILILLITIPESVQWSGHYHSYRVVSKYIQVEWCDYHCWWHCCSHSHRTEALYATQYRCDPMWTHNGDYNCNIPLCSSSCGNGKCIAEANNVHSCDSPDDSTGSSGSGHDCSFNDPCYPGQCQPGSSRVICNCQHGFSGSSCLKMPDDWKATIINTHARMSFWKRGTQNAKEEYGLEIYSTETTTTKWTNMEKFNWLNVTATALFDKETPPRPSYISESGFGITNATVNIKLLKLASGALGADLREENIPCSATISPDSPVDVADCVISKPSFDYLLENGGFRKLIDRKTGANKGTERYTMNKVTTSVAYQFDFVNPIFTGSKHDAFYTNNDFTKLSISFRWTGWKDDLSGMGKYVLEFFHLEPNGDGDLREVNTSRPINQIVVNHIAPIIYPLPITPPGPGMYSFVLGAADRANNTVYMRRCILYDPESSVTTDSSHGLFIRSSQRDSTGQQWTNDPSASVVATWTGHFLNHAHETGKYLNKVLPLKILLVPDENIYKYVTPNLDDYEGKRTVNAVPNVRGIVHFETSRALNTSGGIIETDPLDWKDGSNLTTSLTFNEANTTSGSTLTFWVKATDAMGNKKVDSTSVSFDFSKPAVGAPVLQRNKPSEVAFSSLLKVPSTDHESGIDHVQVKVTQISNGHLLTNQTISVHPLEPKECTDKITDCYCPSTLTVCYKRINDLYISNCWLMVSKDSLKTAEVRLELGVVNRAGLMSVSNITITDLMSLNGTEAYFGPINVQTDKISQTGVKVTWHHAPSCYPRSFIWLSYNSGEMIKIFKDAESYDLTGLVPGKLYTVEVMTDYGGIKSKPVKTSFKTMDAPGIGKGTIAGIAVGALLIIVVLAVGIFLWRTGKAAAVIRKQQSGISRRTRRGQSSEDQTSGAVYNDTRPKNSNMNNKPTAYKNKVYDGSNANDADDIYLYGSMEFAADQPWYIPKSMLTLEKELTVGRFARIYKATHRSGKTREVVAKMAKDEQTEETNILMIAKINFAATQVGQHRNVIGFVGAVLDNDALGPVMVMEYCKEGQLDKWLCSRRNGVDMKILENLQTFALQVARGMEYLTKKKIVHRKLAARNCLLTRSKSDYEIKIAGFGPSRVTDDNDDENSRGDRIPVKWTAPECLKTLKGANENSDMWSYGVTLWEIFSLGEVPYPNIRSRDLSVKVQNGHRLERPKYAEDIHFELMKSCWQQKPSQRPTFTEVVDQLERSFGLTPSSDAVYY